jgi:hypothetical protein
MMEALDPRCQSTISADLLDECERLLREHETAGGGATEDHASPSPSP